jgi:hypothetical protein
MNVSEVLDIDGSVDRSKKLVVGDKITIQSFKIKSVEEVGAEVVEIGTTDGLRHSFGKAIIGQAKSDYWKDVVEKCVDKDAADGLDAYVVEKEAEKTGRMMLCLSMFPPKN